MDHLPHRRGRAAPARHPRRGRPPLRPRTTPVPRSGLTLDVRTERGVTFLADGRETTVRTNAATIQEALDQAGITLHGQDATSVPPTAFPRDGQIVTVLRITGTREVREERIPYEIRRVRDDDLFAGTEVVERIGGPERAGSPTACAPSTGSVRSPAGSPTRSSAPPSTGS